MFLTLFTFIILLSVLVFVHELGHFWVARRFGVKPEEFGIGFPPRALGVYRNKEGKWSVVRGRKKVEDASDTVYSINWVPLGGYVKLGEDDEGGDDPNHFSNKPVWQRLAMILAGVTMNVILAMALISFGYMMGLPQMIDNVHPKAEVSNRQIQILEVLPDSPAASAELKMGDVIVGINGIEFENSDELQVYVDEHRGEALTYTIKRGQEEISKQITPEVREETNKGGIGIGIAETGLVKLPFLLAIWQGITTAIFLTVAIVVAFFEVIKGLVLGQGVSADLAGPVGIAALTGQVARMGFVYILQFAAILSINLAIINAFPFPALDGGRVLFLIIEKIKGSPVKKEVEAVIHNIGFVLLMILILVVTFRDISRFKDSIFMFWEKIVG